MSINLSTQPNEQVTWNKWKKRHDGVLVLEHNTALHVVIMHCNVFHIYKKIFYLKLIKTKIEFG